MHNLIVSDQCNLKCLGCPVWKSRPGKAEADTLRRRILNQRFFDCYPRKKLYHLVGGEPLFNPDLPLIITYLKSQNSRLFLWTNGTEPLDRLGQGLDYLDRVFIYLPSPDPDEYVRITGDSRWYQLLDNLALLKEKQKQVWLHFPISATSVSYLSDVREFAYEQGVKLLIHWQKNGDLSKESLGYIRRFRRVSGVWMFHRRPAPLPLCAGLPYGSMDKPWNYFREQVNQRLVRFRSQFGL